ncbi:hypothetical protein HK103_006226 [Boothiomyces macroporosus]|uniref:Uncharacterized protein n=1 Tax=Boothiomyces macroporosus TaxID=261099 RepID=A0AAD5UE39_9FUNG|nr:hypothetical protein HK103_006220 [Boothiomyces macroporosus]KAJ3255501.1 hypothetical protein HK103_006226 [Boothiomyces macroporosus]
MECRDSEGWGPISHERLYDFTICFQYILQQIPTIFLLFTGLIFVATLHNKPRFQVPKTTVFYTLQISCFILLISNAIGIKDNYLLITPTAGYLLAMGFHYLELSYSRVSLYFLLFFWLMNIVVNLIVLRSLYLARVFEFTLENIVYSTNLLLSLLNFLLELLPKPESYYMSLDEDEHVTPEINSHIFARIYFAWMGSLMKLGYQKVLTMEDLWTLAPSDSAAHNSVLFQKHLSAQLTTKRPSLVKALFSTFSGTVISTALFKFMQDCLQFTQPQLLALMMAYAARFNKDSSIDEGIGIAGLMLITAMTQTIFLHQYFHGCFMLGMRVRSTMITAVYNKALRLSNSARQGSTVGEITNLMAVDASKLADLCNNMNILWSGPFQISIAVYFLYKTLGASVFGGIAIMIIMIPINGYIASVSRALNKKQMKNKDTRTKLMDEILSGIKVLKLYAWEKPFYEKINAIRELELFTLKNIAYLQCCTSFTWSCTPFLVSFTTFAIYSVFGSEPLTSTKVFVSLSLFNLLGFPLAAFPQVIASVVEASVSISRLLKFFLNEEKDDSAVTLEFVPPFRDENSPPAERICVENGTFGWAKDGESILSDISFSVTDAALLAVVGPVGAGKSSLLSAILGDTYKQGGSVTVRGTIAYVPQTAWIMNSTVRENILFGQPFDEAFYNQTVQACGLGPDLDSLIAGDFTEIGERGINLSGGQKQRIAIARAVYSRADIYLFDDALSAVDAHVGRHIFDHILGPAGLLKSKARVFVTHGIHYLPQVDAVMTLNNGTIGEMGTYQALMSNKSHFYNLIKEYGKQKNEQPKELKSFAIGKILKEENDKTKTQNGTLIEKETSAKGKVNWKVYQTYAQSCNSWYVIGFLCIAVLAQGISVSQNILLSEWAKSNDNGNTSVLWWLVGYGSLGLLYSSFVVFQVLFAWVFCGIGSARHLHDDLLRNVLRLPQSFFDTTPLGRIINRFSKDQYTIDEVLPRSFLMFFRTLFQVLAVLAINTFGNVYYLLLAIPLGLLYYYFQRYYLSTSRELKRLDSTSRSPIYQNFQETLNGVSSIRAYGQSDRFIKINEGRVDYNQRAYYPSVSSNRWLAVRLEFIGSLIVFGSGTFGVLALKYQDYMSSSLLGLMLVYSLNVTQTLNWMVRQSCEIETNIVSVERIKEYIELPQEAPAHIEEAQPPPHWPQHGAISFKNYSTRYRAELDLVVKNLNIDIKGKEKIGIVGRTGAGKSSLTLALFRIIEPASGFISIDNVNICNIGLEDLRSAISIIPQDPVLFCGSVRYNLDPFGKSSDADLWAALEKANLKDYIASREGGLSYEVVQGGENFSVGQRQLICLARALVRNTKILILDEATAAIDVETDAIIQKTIRQEMKESTILTIAHRINTVMDSDRIIVLDKGVMVEFDTPKKLLANKSSKFYALAKEAGQTK